MAELRNRHGFPLEMTAVKAQMKGQVELVNDGLRAGTIKIPPESEVAADMMKTLWDKDLAAKNRWEYSSIHHPDPSEAFRYAFGGMYPAWMKQPDLRTPRHKQLDEEMDLMDKRARIGEDEEESWMPTNPFK